MNTVSRILLAIGLLLQSFPLLAATLRHSIWENDTMESLQTQRVCYGFALIRGRYTCLPTPYLNERSGKISISANLHANEKAYGIVSRFVEKDLDQRYLDKLFKEDNFQAASGAISIDAIYGKTAFSYTPIHMAGAFKIINPSLPELKAAAVKQSSLKISHNFHFFRLFGKEVGDLLIAPSVKAYERTTVNANMDLLSYSTRHVSDLVETSHTPDGDMDLAVAFLSRNPWLPTLSLRLQNLTAEKDSCDNCGEEFFNIEQNYHKSSSASASYSLRHSIGQSIVGAQIPYWGVYREMNPMSSSVSYTYQLATLGAFTAFSPYMQSFGFLFNTDHMKLGIRYTDEKQDNALQIERRKHAYVFGGYNF